MSGRLRRRPRWTHAASIPAALLAVLALLAGCGDDTTSTSGAPSESGSPSGSPSASLPDLPPCEDVWVPEKTLPKGYTGCREGDVAVAAAAQKCSFGRVLVTYADQYYGVPGFTVQYFPDGLATSREYRQARRACGG